MTPASPTPDWTTHGKHARACRAALVTHLRACPQCTGALAPVPTVIRPVVCETGLACLDELAIARRLLHRCWAQAAA